MLQLPRQDATGLGTGGAGDSAGCRILSQAPIQHPNAVVDLLVNLFGNGSTRCFPKENAVGKSGRTYLYPKKEMCHPFGCVPVGCVGE